MIELLLASYLVTQTWAADAVVVVPPVNPVTEYCVYWSQVGPTDWYTSQSICGTPAEVVIDGTLELDVPGHLVPTDSAGDLWFFNITARNVDGETLDHGPVQP